jgi:hypothetical protein
MTLIWEMDAKHLVGLDPLDNLSRRRKPTNAPQALLPVTLFTQSVVWSLHNHENREVLVGRSGVNSVDFDPIFACHIQEMTDSRDQRCEIELCVNSSVGGRLAQSISSQSLQPK